MPGNGSVVRTARVRAGEDVFPLAEIVPWVQDPAAFPPSSVNRDRLRGLPTLPLPPIEEHGDDGAVSEPPLKALVQLVLVPRHNQQVQDRRPAWTVEAIRADWHGSPRVPHTYHGKGRPSRQANSRVVSQLPRAEKAKTRSVLLS